MQEALKKSADDDVCGQTQRESLQLDELLIPNVNTWGNVHYNVPLRHSNNETRTAMNIAHRFIPPIPHALDCVSNFNYRPRLRKV